jgi:hypothetical protein
MRRLINRRGWLSLPVVALLVGAMTIFSPSAQASPTRVWWSIYDTYGYIDFTSSHGYTISTTMNDPYSQGWVTSWSTGQYFVGNERDVCGGTPSHTVDGYGTTFVDHTSCSSADIQLVMIIEYHTGEFFDVTYVANPKAQ